MAAFPSSCPTGMAGTVGAAVAAAGAGGLRLSAGIGGSWTSDPDAPALCDQHCQRDHIATADAKAPQVPYQPALVAFALVQALLPPVHAQFYRDVPVCVSDPPPLQRFCSLLI